MRIVAMISGDTKRLDRYIIEHIIENTYNRTYIYIHSKSDPEKSLLNACLIPSKLKLKCTFKFVTKKIRYSWKIK